MKIYIVGIGTDGNKTLTNEAKDAVASSELLIGAKRMTLPFTRTNKEIYNSYQSDEIADKIKKTDAKTVSILMSGDCGFFSGAKNIMTLLNDHDVDVIPGISSMAYFCCRVGMSYENMKFVSLHGIRSNIAVKVISNEKCFFLLGGNIGVPEICRTLIDYSLEHVCVYIGENLGYENEKLIIGRPDELVTYISEKLSVVIIENKQHIDHIPIGINDDDFIREKIPMTKSVIRSSIISGLRINKESICWDIGSGSGSVSVEMAYQCPDGTVYAFDKNRDACELTKKNAKKFSCDNVQIIEGKCPEILTDMPVPDKVFIGGSSGKLSEIFAVINNKNPFADIVLTAVTLETLTSAAEQFDKYKGKYEMTQIAVTNTKKNGNSRLFQAENPVFLFKGKLNE